jgi:hypothetical protein
MATMIWIAGFSSASITIKANNRFMSTSLSRITAVNGTIIVIVTIYIIIFTSSVRVTRINRTSVIIIAINF